MNVYERFWLCMSQLMWKIFLFLARSVQVNRVNPSASHTGVGKKLKNATWKVQHANTFSSTSTVNGMETIISGIHNKLLSRLKLFLYSLVIALAIFPSTLALEWYKPSF